MIGEADTLAPRPTAPPWSDTYAKGALGTLQIGCQVTGLGYIDESFSNVDNWINVHGELKVDEGDQAYGPVIGYAAARHRTQLLSDNCRAKITLQSATVFTGESRVIICSDELMSSYYGVAIQKTIVGSKLAIIRGTSSVAVDKYEETSVSLNVYDEIEVWYDRKNSTVRVYKNDAEICAKYFPPTDIPHGPGARYTGVVMSCMKFLNGGPRFKTFVATDVPYPVPIVHDPVDSLTVNPSWVQILDSVEVHRHAFEALTLGPDTSHMKQEAAVRWSTAMTTNSVRAVVTVRRYSTGKFRLAVRSDANMLNWVGVEFSGATSKVAIVKGTSPTTTSVPSGDTTEKVWVQAGQQWTVTWDEDSKTIKVYRSGKPDPLLSWETGSSFEPTGKYVGLSWSTSFYTAGVEVSSVDAYNVGPDDPLPIG